MIYLSWRVMAVWLNIPGLTFAKEGVWKLLMKFPGSLTNQLETFSSQRKTTFSKPNEIYFAN